MKSNPNQLRKIIYALVIVGLFGAMWPYGTWLNKVKTEKDLGEATIGQIDTGDIMLKLALLGGARGMAANYLWSKAEGLKKAQEWDELKSTIDFITRLQPHFLSVWTFQGWNLAYNVSVEWDAPEDKYDWIKQGIKFLQEGVRKNSRSPDLQWDTAWTYYHKLGFADETIILRRLFRDDTDEAFKFDPEDRVVRNDNFQLGRGWFLQSMKLVDSGLGERLNSGTGKDVNATFYVDAPSQRKGRENDLAFRSMAAHAQTRYAAGLEKESMQGIPATFGEVAKSEWAKSLSDWVTFGQFKFPAHNDAAVNIQIDDCTNPTIFYGLTENARYWTDRWGSQMNYPYWKDRSAAELTDEGVAARRLFYEGTKAYKSADFPLAVDKFKQGLDIWKLLLDKHESYRNDELNQRDTGLIVRRYVRSLRQYGKDVPEDTPFLALGKASEGSYAPDPFDALEMMPVGATASPSSATAPTQPAPK